MSFYSSKAAMSAVWVMGLAGVVGVVGVVGSARAANFVSSVPADQYVVGDVFIASGASYSNTAAVVGAPGKIVAPTSAYASALTPFSPHYETSELVAIGRGGSITLRFGSAVPVGGQTKVAVYTNAGFFDYSYPDGVTGPSGETSVKFEYSAERTAVVEVGDGAGNFVSLGRQVFDDPSNAYADVGSAFEFPVPVGRTPADYAKPYESTASRANKSLAAILADLDGSAGGTWISVPETIGLTAVAEIRLSDPMWMLDTGELVTHATSRYDTTFNKPADLFIDAAVAIPEPTTLAAVMGGAVLVMSRRRVGR